MPIVSPYPPEVTRPPPGWTTFGGKLEPLNTVAGCLARHDRVVGKCDVARCRRKVDVDLQELARFGFGALYVDKIQQFLRCQDLAGCNFDLRIERGPGLPIELLRGRPHVRIRFACRGKDCRHFHLAMPDAVLTKLRSTAGAPATPCLHDLPSLTRAPCPACGKTNWDVTVLWPDTTTIGYQLDLQKAGTL